MTNEKMIEMMEFFEMFETFKAMKSKQTESTRTTAVAVNNTNTVDKFFGNGNFVQRGSDIVDLGESKNASDVLTKFEMYEQEFDGKKYYCIKSSICTGKKMVDKVTGKEYIKKFNISAKQLANNMIKSVDDIITLDIPFTDKKGCWKAWGFKTKKKALEALETLPKVVKGADIEKKNAEYQAKKNGGRV